MTSKFAPTDEELEFAYSSIGKVPPKSESTPQQGNSGISQEELEFAQVSANEPIPDEIPWWISVPSAAAKGLFRGIVGLGQTFGGLPEKHPGQREQQRLQNEMTLEKMLPSEPGIAEKFVGRGGEILPSIAAGPGGIGRTLAQTGIAAASGQLAEELGSGETGQALAEIGSLALPAIGRRIVASDQRQQQLLDFGRKMGLSEEQLAPAIQNESLWKRLLSRAATRRGQTETALQKTREALGDIYQTLASSPAANVPISQQQAVPFLSRMHQALINLPSNIRNVVIQDFRELASKPVTGKELINFYQDVNDAMMEIGGNRGRRLGTLYDPIRDALSAVSPQLAQDFNMTNELYQNYSRLAGNLRPNIATDLFGAGEAYAIMHAFITGNYPILGGTLGAQAGRKLAASMLTNPRLVNLGNKVIESLNSGKFEIANNVKDLIVKEIQKENPEVALEFEKIDFTSLGGNKSHEGNQAKQK